VRLPQPPHRHRWVGPGSSMLTRARLVGSHPRQMRRFRPMSPVGSWRTRRFAA
jgi:hypothetical protein